MQNTTSSTSTHDRRHFAKRLALAAVASAAVPLAARAASTEPAEPSTPKPLPAFSALQFGAKGDGLTDDTSTVQKAIDACADAGGGTVVLDAGHSFLCGSLTLRSHVDFHLAPGSLLKAHPAREKYHATGALLFAKDSVHVRVSGTGVIDGNFQAFFLPPGPDGYAVPQPFLGPYDPLASTSERNPPDGRPRMLLLIHCRHLRLEEFTVRNSPTWTIHPIGCEDLYIGGLSILNDLKVPNCDGIDIDHCRNVRVEGCNIVAGDDCLILKASRNFGEYGPCESVTISNCTLESSSAAIKVEPEGPFPVRDIVVNACTLVRSNRGISILNRDGATVERLVFSNLVIHTKMQTAMWWGSGEPIAVTSLPRDPGGPAGWVRDVTFSNLVCRGESGILLRGSEGAPLQNLAFQNVALTLEKITDFPGGAYDMRPGATFGPSGFDRRKTAALLATSVDALALHGLTISWGEHRPDYFGSALELHHCNEVSLAQVQGQEAHGGVAAVFDAVTFASEISPRA